MYWTSDRAEELGDLLGVAVLTLEQARERLRLLAQLALEVRRHAAPRAEQLLRRVERRRRPPP